MSQVDIKRQMFIADVVHRMARSDSWEFLPPLDAMLLANRSQRLSMADWSFGMQGMQLARREAASMPGSVLPKGASALDRMLTWSEDNFPGTIPIVDTIREDLQRSADIRSMKLNETGLAAYDRRFIYDKFSPRAEEILGEFYDVAQTNEGIAGAWSRLIARDLGDVTATPEQVITRNPELSGVFEGLRNESTREAGRAAAEVQVKTLASDLRDTESGLKLVTVRVHGVRR